MDEEDGPGRPTWFQGVRISSMQREEEGWQ